MATAEKREEAILLKERDVAEDDQRKTILKLLRTAEILAKDIPEPTLAYLIGCAIDEAQAKTIDNS